MSEQESEYTYWKHSWKGTCSCVLKGHDWGQFTSIWEEITIDEYEDWVWNRKKIWMWDKDTAREELGLELL